MRVFHSSSVQEARSVEPHLSVEAEYGSVVVEGSIYTAAHHQPAGTKWAGDHVQVGGMPAPCVDENIPQMGEGFRVLISHLDLDTVGGVLRALPGAEDLFVEDFGGFWELAGFVDVKGAHRIHESPSSSMNRDRLYAWWAFSRTLPRLPREGITDVTETILKDCLTALRRILACDPEMMELGREFRKAESTLNESSFKTLLPSRIILRQNPSEKDSFVNHLYTTPTGEVGRSVVGFNPFFGSITISLESPIEGVSCRELVQKLWGPEAGGHPGIAGSPRDRKMGEEEVYEITKALERALASA